MRHCIYKMLWRLGLTAAILGTLESYNVKANFYFVTNKYLSCRGALVMIFVYPFSWLFPFLMENWTFCTQELLTLGSDCKAADHLCVNVIKLLQNNSAFSGHNSLSRGLPPWLSIRALNLQTASRTQRHHFKSHHKELKGTANTIKLKNWSNAAEAKPVLSGTENCFVVAFRQNQTKIGK